jgi:hypothetical protein
MKLVSITKATDGKHKYTAVFSDPKKTTHFGQEGANDFIIYSKQDKQLAEIKKKAYLARHKVNEDFNSPTTAGALSKWILWNKSTLGSSIADYKKHFNL